jgi:hypothetical protein
VTLESIARVALAISLAGALAPARAAEDDLRRATQLLERNHYESAAAILRADGNGGAPGGVAALTLGRAYARSAELYRALHRSSLATGTRYLQQVATQGGADRSRLVALYYGEYLIEAARTKEGVAQLRRFLAQKDLPAPYRDIAEAALAAAQGRPAPAQAKSADPVVRIQAAAAMSRAEAKRAEAVALVDRAIEELRKAGALPTRAAAHAIGVYVRGGRYEKAFALAGAADLGRPSHEETIGRSKVIRFYDAALLGNLAALHQAAAERLLAEARNDARLKAVGGYFLAELHLKAGETAKAAGVLSTLAAAGDLPAAYRDRAAVLQAAVDVRDGQAARGNAAFVQLAQKHAQEPVMLAETLAACVRAGGGCAGVADSARALALTSQAERFRALHRAVGEQYAAAGDAERALASLETARDKANKNRIDTNDPLLLVELADLYLAAKSFSENLEIYFELAKEFPAVRQLQEAGQGIYSTEYRSAGDVKIF